MTISEIISKFKSKEHFRVAYEKEGKLLPEDTFLGWNYIKQILSGEKLLIDLSQLKDFDLPPRFNKKIAIIQCKIFMGNLQ